ncbi:hypothetical protein Esi_0106_0062 [Ectocarpus siliculosus]|uniref:Uncharacterized protein n=1 Tax=Ectocarpus siliculosus TaxID=2880 RepID=D7FH95_ECTSI|nr:hypothetical protein Esi_0106_0062 [Ectocarpus siliculosus]|eukprot:CBJ28466.1 hypothetical protein Esi_0106_0062 [Ectocarpus siliculosus]
MKLTRECHLSDITVHGYSPEDARRALTICHEMRTLEAAGVGGVAAAQELTRRVLCGTGAVVGGGGGVAGMGELGARSLLYTFFSPSA